MELTSNVVEYQMDSGVAWVKLASPKTGNALNATLISQLSQSIQQAIADPSCRVIVISALGSDFCKGLQFEEAVINQNSPNPKSFDIFLDCLNLISRASQVTIACVEGNVTGGGVGLVAACDLVLAKEDVVFMLPEVIVGMIPALISPFILRRLPLARLRYITLSARGIPAIEAQVFGLVDEVVTEEISHSLNRQIQRLFRASPLAIAESKKYFEQLDSLALPQQKEIARERIKTWLQQPDIVEEIKNFAEGFSPAWFQKYKGKIHV
ncbi:enoyl-CoA hydratase/isomerase family protein [Nostoc sp. CENA67]|uniref:Enoyl-CoA hydratase/isomerase family protein n=1 Tax=Amazonocrinis nigriterrae CENA67 TaxID=2794033 RepID=A0A8J7HKT2_9NOST|nr:enoyl-CoA hydratase-related protein [Amazonocrinis nigriterrae]MBH8561401.1 enoyl-CoA hydratase/isomerase family protein [Amazonocrinis nigriterrae CENA67]